MNLQDRRPPPPLLERISFLIHRINAHLMRHMNPKLKDWGIDLTESRLLVALLDLGPLSAGELVRIMALPQSTVSHQMKRLEKRGYVSRTPDAADSRVVIASLTDAGHAIALQAEEYSRIMATQFAEAIGSDSELELVRAAMKRIDQALAPRA
jgi:DNA-binding MarR family transcriptional regulator